MRCLPFAEAMYRCLQQQGLDAESLWSDRGRFGRGRRWPASAEGLVLKRLGLDGSEVILKVEVIHACWC